MPTCKKTSVVCEHISAIIIYIVAHNSRVMTVSQEQKSKGDNNIMAIKHEVVKRHRGITVVTVLSKNYIIK